MPNTKEPWHLDKRVPVAMIFTIVAQTAAVVWFFATLDGRVGTLERDVERNRLTNSQLNSKVSAADRQAATQEEKLNNILRVVERIERRIESSRHNLP